MCRSVTRKSNAEKWLPNNAPTFQTATFWWQTLGQEQAGRLERWIAIPEVTNQMFSKWQWSRLRGRGARAQGRTRCRATRRWLFVGQNGIFLQVFSLLQNWEGHLLILLLQRGLKWNSNSKSLSMLKSDQYSVFQICRYIATKSSP